MLIFLCDHCYGGIDVVGELVDEQCSSGFLLTIKV